MSARLLMITALGLLAARSVIAQDSPAPSPTAAPPSEATRSVQISFVPPPIEGAISLGIYDAKGKLVRALHRESSIDDFTAESDALMTEWDGKNDRGEDLPAGKYSARGVAVGPLAVEGVAYFFNDWVTEDDAPHPEKIETMALDGNNLLLRATFPSGDVATVSYDLTQDSLAKSKIADRPAAPSPIDLTKLTMLIDPIASAAGKNGTLWVIDHPEKNSEELELKQLSAQHDILRRLAYAKTDPQPKAIVASPREEKIFVLEESPNEQRLRALSLLATKPAADKSGTISDWKVDFEKTITSHQTFSLQNGRPVMNGDATASQKIAQQLQANPLKRDKTDRVQLSVGFDADGSYLQTEDGLPLKTISDTPNLSRALLTAVAKNAIDVFQDDGAVVEQYRISGADKMMAFECGDFELK